MGSWRRLSPRLSLLLWKLRIPRDCPVERPQMVSPGHGTGDSAGKTGGTRGTAPDLLYVSPASLGGSAAGAYSVCPASVCRVKMMPGLSLGLSSELFAELGWVSPGALSSCPSAIKIPGWERGGSCRSSRGRQPGAPRLCWSWRSREGDCNTAALPGAVPLLIPKLVCTLSMESKWTNPRV